MDVLDRVLDRTSLGQPLPEGFGPSHVLIALPGEFISFGAIITMDIMDCYGIEHMMTRDRRARDNQLTMALMGQLRDTYHERLFSVCSQARIMGGVWTDPTSFFMIRFPDLFANKYFQSEAIQMVQESLDGISFLPYQTIIDVFEEEDQVVASTCLSFFSHQYL
jgi:hypothetical protein